MNDYNFGWQNNHINLNQYLGINDCFIHNEKGKQLIEFILHQPYEKLHDLSNEIILYLKKIQNNGYLAQRDGYIWISNQQTGK